MRVNLTAGRVNNHDCEPGKKQSFLWDSTVPGLAVRTSPTKKAFIFQSRLDGRSIRITIGDVRTWGIDEARAEARRLGTLIDQGVDPRQEKRERLAAQEREQARQAKEAITLADAWSEYVEARQPHWSTHHHKDHLKVAYRGGESRQRGKGKRTPGVLASLMDHRLADLDQATLKKWISKEGKKRATQTNLGFRLLRAFLRWCEDEPRFQGLADPAICSTRLAKQHLPKQGTRTDCLTREQLPAWFKAVRALDSATMAAYFQTLLLTGARRGELASLRWSDVDFRWNTLTIRDKVEGERTIPLTSHVASLLDSLERENDWVFASTTSATGHLMAPTRRHTEAAKAAGVEGLTLHGLRRSFGTLSEWVEAPAGIVAQIQGHKPSAIVEKHYRQRPIDLLRQWHQKIEDWILEQADIHAEPPKKVRHLRAV
ncbi:tyrosine-type recombinase/integrase [Guyparkeria halophila]|uniref:Tyrosine-type recombinase/integrase n=1 Tax=Guyparkeria halophila TaxID=47960 RepID=A0A6I6D814_9GAMM|nr:integrase family protein [Guyparkeria halophila]QGT77522.1 tyrosine-type recombinase/integrase [Guyparkeria halophila]